MDSKRSIPTPLPCDRWKDLNQQRIGFIWDTREAHIPNQGWFVLTQEVARRLGSYLRGKQVVEVFAGTGYLAHHLRKTADLDRRSYRAYDNRTGWASKVYYPGVSKKNAFRALIKRADVVVMTWPEYTENHAVRIVTKMEPGQVLVYNGEPQGGCCANDRFFEILDRDFIKIESLSNRLNDGHFTFFGIHDRWAVYKKRR